ncbi:hypothetical protein AMTRI_Chr13g86050 [Amborella trichopoda]
MLNNGVSLHFIFLYFFCLNGPNHKGQVISQSLYLLLGWKLELLSCFSLFVEVMAIQSTILVRVSSPITLLPTLPWPPLEDGFFPNACQPSLSYYENRLTSYFV